jgi:hypothetical protein
VAKRWAIVLIVAVSGLLLLGFDPAVYVVRSSGGGVLYWNASEALLFMGGGNMGVRMSYLRYAAEPFIVGLGHVRRPDEKSCSRVIVIEVTDKNVEQHDTEVGCVFSYNVIGGHIYALSGPQLWVWSGNEFQPASVEEIRSFEASNSTRADSSHPWQFDDVQGWSMRELRQTPAQHRILLNGQFVTIVFHGTTWPPRPLSVDLIRPGQAAQTIWSFDEAPRRVSKGEYAHLFLQAH